jgi:NAD-dependent deacetylase
MEEMLTKAAELLKISRYTVVFTGAGISAESGIPTFRGESGLWSKYDPMFLELGYFRNHPEKSWKVLKEIFYDFFANARPNPAHLALAEMERKELIKTVITQNIDNLHQLAGNRMVFEFHGSTRQMICLDCGGLIDSERVDLDTLPPRCNQCEGILKPNLVFFNELISTEVSEKAFVAAEKAEVLLLVGTTGEIMPAAYLPYIAKEKNNAMIIEVNPEESLYTSKVTDVFLKGKAGEILPRLLDLIIN